MWTFLSLLTLFYAAIFLYKIYNHDACEKIFEKWGIDIGLFQFKINFSAKRRWVSNTPTMRKCKNFYKYGSLLSLVLIIPSLLFLIWNLVKIIMLTQEQNNPEKAKQIENELVFQPVIPGVTFPLTDFGAYAISLIITTAFHELGHALAADCQDVKILGYGMLVMFIIPAAFVDLSTSELNSLSLSDQLKVYTAGIWHNLVLALLALAFIFLQPYFLQPLYEKGVAVLKLNENSTVQGVKIGQVLTFVNDCKLSKASDFYACVKSQELKQAGYCLTSQDLANLDCPECCLKKNESYLNFLNKATEDKFCLPVRQALNSSSGFCSTGLCQNCLHPVLDFPFESLWQIQRKNSPDFLFIGFSNDLFRGIEAVTDYVPKFWFAPLSLPLWLEKCSYYTGSFSLALALINIVPCFMLDGQFIIQTAMKYCCPPSRSLCISNFLIYTGTALLLSNLALAFLLIQ